MTKGMILGFDRYLYVLPFDHRGSCEIQMFGWEGGPLTPEQTAKIAAAKQVVYDGFRAAVTAGVPKEKAGILVDEEFGAGSCATRRRRDTRRRARPRRAARRSLTSNTAMTSPGTSRRSTRPSARSSSATTRKVIRR